MNLGYIHHQHHSFEDMESLDGDDTVFYTELTRRILMIMDDDQDETINARRNVKLGSRVQTRPAMYSGSEGCFSGFENGRRCEVPIWLERLWGGNTGGTGVFIPRVEAAAGKFRRRRRNKPRKN
ncbi:hypothetical protein R6Q57_015226 [Mikania cordata]